MDMDMETCNIAQDDTKPSAGVVIGEPLHIVSDVIENIVELVNVEKEDT